MNSMTQTEAIITVLSLVTLFVAWARRFVELLPFARPNSPLHDATLQALNVLLNGAGVLAVALTYHTFDPAQWLGYLLLITGQSVGSHAFYSIVKASSSNGSGSVASAPAPVTPSDTMVAVAADAAQQSEL